MTVARPFTGPSGARGRLAPESSRGIVRQLGSSPGDMRSTNWHSALLIGEIACKTSPDLQEASNQCLWSTEGKRHAPPVDVVLDCGFEDAQQVGADHADLRVRELLER